MLIISLITKYLVLCEIKCTAYTAGGSNFTLVRQSLDTLNMWKRGTYTDTQAVASCCAKHNQHVKHANTGGSGICPQEYFENKYFEIEFGSILGI